MILAKREKSNEIVGPDAVIEKWSHITKRNKTMRGERKKGISKRIERE